MTSLQVQLQGIFRTYRCVNNGGKLDISNLLMRNMILTGKCIPNHTFIPTYVVECEMCWKFVGKLEKLIQTITKIKWSWNYQSFVSYFPIVVLFLSKQMMLNYRKSHLLLITMSRIGLFLYLLYTTLRITTKNIFFQNYYEDISKIWWRQFLYSFKEIS